jgi:RNA ligase
MLLEKIRRFDIPTVDVIRPFDNILSLVEYTRTLKGAEGFIVAFDDGHKVKIKADEYVRIHKTMDRVMFDRNIVDLIINEEVDDIISMLPVAQVTRIRDFEARFWEAFKVKEEMLLADRGICAQVYGNDRKRIALEYIPKLSNKMDAQFIFRMVGGISVRELLLEHIRKSISTNTKWEQTAEWLGM